MPQAGQIISWPKYRFPEGNIRDKLFIVLNDSLRESDPCLLLITTGQEKWYRNYQPGCNYDIKTFYIPIEWGECFHKPTFVKLPLIVEKTCLEIWKQYEDGVIVWRRKLAADCMKGLKDCLKLFVKDIQPRHYSIIF
jgi:hypothetical protein